MIFLKKKQATLIVFSALAMLILIIDSSTAVHAAQDGIKLCLQSLIPSLFPFLFLSGLLLSGLDGESGQLAVRAAKVLHIPTGFFAVLLTSFLGGYPVGAACVGRAVSTGVLRREEASRILAYCNNCGPSFLFGVAGAMLPQHNAALFIWLIQIMSAVCCILFTYQPGQANGYRANASRDIPQMLRHTIFVMTEICGWVILFRVLLAFLNRWFLCLCPVWFSCFVSGLLELTNGCMMLPAIADDRLRFLLCCAMITGGGFCVLLQTASVWDGFSAKQYLRGKCFQVLIAAFFACLHITFGFIACSGVFSGIVILKAIMQKKSSIPAALSI